MNLSKVHLDNGYTRPNRPFLRTNTDLASRINGRSCLKDFLLRPKSGFKEARKKSKSELRSSLIRIKNYNSQDFGLGFNVRTKKQIKPKKSMLKSNQSLMLSKTDSVKSLFENNRKSVNNTPKRFKNMFNGYFLNNGSSGFDKIPLAKNKNHISRQDLNKKYTVYKKMRGIGNEYSRQLRLFKRSDFFALTKLSKLRKRFINLKQEYKDFDRI